MLLVFSNESNVYFRRHAVNDNGGADQSRDNDRPFDLVTVKDDDNKLVVKMTAQFQQIFATLSMTSLGDFLGDSERTHFEARDAALARL